MKTRVFSKNGDVFGYISEDGNFYQFNSFGEKLLGKVDNEGKIIINNAIVGNISSKDNKYYYSKSANSNGLFGSLFDSRGLPSTKIIAIVLIILFAIITIPTLLFYLIITFIMKSAERNKARTATLTPPKLSDIKLPSWKKIIAVILSLCLTFSVFYSINEYANSDSASFNDSSYNSSTQSSSAKKNKRVSYKEYTYSNLTITLPDTFSPYYDNNDLVYWKDEENSILILPHKNTTNLSYESLQNRLENNSGDISLSRD